MIDDGTGAVVQIPSVYITKRYGDKLKNLLDNGSQTVILKVNFVAYKFDPVNY